METLSQARGPHCLLCMLCSFPFTLQTSSGRGSCHPYSADGGRKGACPGHSAPMSSWHGLHSEAGVPIIPIPCPASAGDRCIGWFS